MGKRKSAANITPKETEIREILKEEEQFLQENEDYVKITYSSSEGSFIVVTGDDAEAKDYFQALMTATQFLYEKIAEESEEDAETLKASILRCLNNRRFWKSAVIINNNRSPRGLRS